MPIHTKPSDQTTRQPAATESLVSSNLEERLLAFAEQLGRIVGTVQAKTDDWLNRPAAVTEQLTRLRDGAADLLTQFGNGTASGKAAHAPTKRGKTAGSTASAKKGRQATTSKGRSGGKVDAPGKTHRKAPAQARSVKHSDEKIAKVMATGIARRGRRR
jgi:hypothetical protein